MLAWHAELDWVRGGFARMTIFFVLSGYLATRSWGRRRDEGFRSFWVRRTLRLLPMTLVGVALAIVVTLAVGSQTTREALGGDVLAVLSYTSNWHFLDTGQSYGALFERQSAFQHYWSLSIEEQLFLLLPLVLAAGAFLARLLRCAPWVVLATAAAVVGIGALLAAPSPDGIYFGTQTRLIEFLVGAALAASFSSWSASTPTTQSALRWLGRISGVAVVATLALVDRDSTWLYDGGIYLFALPVIAVVVAIEVRDPWLGGVLQLRPLVWLGRAALSIYVLHWPLFVLAEDVVPHGVPEPVLAAAKVTVGVFAGGVAHRLIEQPLLDDTRRLLRDGLPVLRTRLAPMVATAGALAVVAVGIHVPEPAYDFEQAAAAFSAEVPDEGPHRAPASTPGPAEGAAMEDQSADPAVDALRIGEEHHRAAVFGSSTAMMNALGLRDWSKGTDRIDILSGDARLGCGLLQEGRRPQSVDTRGEAQWFPVDDSCEGWPRDWQAAAEATGVDVALVFFGVWEIADWRVGGGDVTSIDDPDFRAVLGDALDEAIDRLVAGGVDDVVLMTSPIVGGGSNDDLAAARALPADHERRTALFNELLRERAAGRPDVSVFDYAAVIEGLGPDLERLVPDGVHPTWDGAKEIWTGAAGRVLLEHLDVIGR